MSILLSILLILLGTLAAETVVAEKAPPACKTFITKLRPFAEQLGLAGLVLGLLALIEWFTKLPFVIGFMPFHMLLALVTILLALSLGLIFGLDIIRRNLKDPGVAFFTSADSLRAKVLPLQQPLGLAAILVGIFCLLMHIL